MLYVIIFFIILVIIEYFWFKYITENKDEFFKDEETDKRLKYNKAHADELTQFFKDTMNERLYALEQMDYEEWLKYCQKNCVLKRDGYEYIVFIYEQGGIDERFIIRSSPELRFLDYNFQIERNMAIENSLILQTFPPYEFLPEQMYKMELKKDGFNQISYNWENLFTQRPEKKITTFTHFHKDNFNGVIGIGYAKEDLKLEYGNIYYNLISKNMVFFFNIIILIIAIILQIINHSLIKTIIILFLSWLLLMYQLSLPSAITNFTMETNKIETITSSVLGVSFLVAVNTFIIRSFDDKKLALKDRTILKSEIIFLFVISVLLLLATLYKENTFESVHQMRSLRINSQIFFNLCLFYNFAICFIFLFFHFNRTIMKKK
jgi:hypothetical protein